MRTFDAEEIAAMLEDMPEIPGDRVEPIYEIVILRTVWGAVELEDIRHPTPDIHTARRIMRAMRAQSPRINMRLEVRTFNSTPL